MSKEYYKYLVGRTVDFFKNKTIQSGEKFILSFNADEEVEAYSVALDIFLDEQAIAKKEYIIQDDDEYKTIGFDTNCGVSVFVVPERNITQAYMTRLRNTIKPNWAMLIVSCNSIDSISEGTENLQKEGLPFYRKKLIDDIDKKIMSSNLPMPQKRILLYDLENKKNNEIFDSHSLNDFDDIIKVLSTEIIEDETFRNFQLLYDEDVFALFNDENDVDARIRENSKLFKQINDSVVYGDPERDLAKDFSEDFIKKVKDNQSKKENWDEGITFSDVKKSQIKKDKNNKQIYIQKVSVSALDTQLVENTDFFVKQEAEKGTKANNKHILICNDALNGDVEIEILFSDSIGKSTLTAINGKSDSTSFQVSGKKLIIKQNHNFISINRIDLKCPERSNSNFKISFCIINCCSSWFKCVTSHYSINAKSTKKCPACLVINCTSDNIVFNIGKPEEEILYLSNETDTDIAYNDAKTIKLHFDDNSFNDDNTALSHLIFDNNVLNILFKEETPQNIPCTGLKIEQKKLFEKQSLLYIGENKISLGTTEYNAQKEFKDNLALEKYIIQNNIVACDFYSLDSIKAIDVDVPEEVLKHYNRMIKFCIANDTLPSLAYYNEDYLSIACKYIESVLVALAEFEENKPLSKSQQDILKIGMVHYAQRSIIAFSPLHPLNVAYQILLTQQAVDMKEEIREDILKKLCSDNLMPMIRGIDGSLFKILEQKHSPQWTYYYKADIKKNNGSRDFVSIIVKDKIIEFYNHFKYMFDNVGGNKIIINAVNMGDCNNLFKGIISYFIKQYNVGLIIDKMMTIVVNVYNNDVIQNAFECLTQKPLLKQFIEAQEFRIDKNKLSENELINCLVSKVKYYKKDINSKKFDYCHLSFIEMDQKTNEGFSNQSDIRSGTMLNGLVSGVSSTYYGQSHSYRTGYGSKFNLNRSDDINIIKLANYYNAAMYVYGQSNPYVSNNVLCTFIDEHETDTIEKSYDSSNWVVFIDPKVDLNFFKKSDKDIMIIHYSDQHTTSSGYDAITVTRKTEQYANIIREYLASNNLPSGSTDAIRKMIDMFNAVNGDWLLKLISSSDNFRKEKISIQSAIKLALAFFKSDNIIWIPIALEEILRVSGAVGLSQNGGLFSAKNLGYKSGATSDDLLMFGIQLRNNKVYVHLYPLEVKIGYKNANEIEKATEQIKRTKEIFDTKLGQNCDENSLQYKFYRNFIAQLAVISAEKLDLYDIWSSQDWERIVNTDIRGKLLNDEFIITDELRNEIGDGIIISFKEGAYMREIIKNDVTVLKFLQNDGIKYLTKSVDEIIEILNKSNDVSSQLFSKMHKNEDNTNNEISISKEDKIETTDNTNIVSPAPNPSVVSNIQSDEGMKILFGSDVNTSKPLYWYPNNTEKVMHPNTGIIGTMGTGKTQFTKSLILQLMREQNNNLGNEPLGILIFDYKGDYNKSKMDFVSEVNAKVYDLYHLPFNPFAITITPDSKPMLPLHIASAFRETLSTAYNLGAKQSATLRECIMQAYELRGIDKADKNTWSNTPPVLNDVLNAFQNSEAFKEDSLYSALSELVEFEIFETDPNKTVSLYDLIDGVTVINLQGYDPSIQNLVVAITLDLFYSQMQANGHSSIKGKLRQLKKFILVDEADNFLKLGFSSIRKILKEGREFGVGTILSTQFLKHFDTQQDDFSKYILSWIVHKVDDLSTKDVKNLFNTDSKSTEDELFSSIKKLQKHHSFVKLGDNANPYYIRDKAFWEMIEKNKS